MPKFPLHISATLGRFFERSEKKIPDSDLCYLI